MTTFVFTIRTLLGESGTSRVTDSLHSEWSRINGMLNFTHQFSE